MRRPFAVLLRTSKGVGDNRLPGLAAEISFWVLLSLPAFAVALIAAVGLVASGGSDWEAQLVQRVVEVSRVVLTGRAIENVVEPLLRRLIEESGVAVISTSFLTAIWTASRAVNATLVTIARVYHQAGVRSRLRGRLLGFALTVGTLVVGAVLAPLLVAGPGFGEQLQALAPIDLSPLAEIWRAAYWPSVVVVATFVLAVLYHLGTPLRTTWAHELPGAVVATGVWLAGSGGLRLYGAWITESQSVYGPLAGPLVVLIWMWLTAFAVLLGAQINASTPRQAHTEDRLHAQGEDENTGDEGVDTAARPGAHD